MMLVTSSVFLSMEKKKFVDKKRWSGCFGFSAEFLEKKTKARWWLLFHSGTGWINFSCVSILYLNRNFLYYLVLDVASNCICEIHLMGSIPILFTNSPVQRKNIGGLLGGKQPCFLCATQPPRLNIKLLLVSSKVVLASEVLDISAGISAVQPVWY